MLRPPSLRLLAMDASATARRLSSYLATLGIEGDSVTFIKKARQAWLAAPKAFPIEYRAHTVNEYTREGFTVVEDQ
jgi:hypothetical protein